MKIQRLLSCLYWSDNASIIKFLHVNKEQTKRLKDIKIFNSVNRCNILISFLYFTDRHIQENEGIQMHLQRSSFLRYYYFRVHYFTFHLKYFLRFHHCFHYIITSFVILIIYSLPTLYIRANSPFESALVFKQSWWSHCRPSDLYIGLGHTSFNFFSILMLFHFCINI